MKRVALIGHSIDYSISPRLHNAAFQALGMDCEYVLLDSELEELPGVIQELRKPDWLGANVTVPFKTAVLELLDRSSEQASAVGAVNTIYKSDGLLCGANTDVAGFLNDLSRQKVAVNQDKVVILGSGGAARAVVFALASKGAELHIISRNEDQATALIHDLESALNTDLQWHPWDLHGFSRAQIGTRLLINATPVGMQPGSRRSPWPDELMLPDRAFVYDLIYKPPISPLLAMAQEQGLPASPGLGMLIEQAALSFEVWTGIAPPIEIMQTIALQELESVND